MKSRFFHKRITAIWEHVGNFGLQSPSIQLNYSNFWLSHITDHNFKMFSWLSDAFFFGLRQPLDWHWKKYQNPSCSKLVFQCVFFCHFTRKQTQFIARFLLHLNIFFWHFLMQHPQLMHQIVMFFVIYSCTKSCFLFTIFRAPYHVVFCFFHAPYRVVCSFFFVHHIAFCCNSSSTKSCLKSNYCNSAW